jgi:hypothetical protein
MKKLSDHWWNQDILSWDSYLHGVGRGWQWVLSAMDLKDNRGHDAQPPAVNVKLQEE